MRLDLLMDEVKGLEIHGSWGDTDRAREVNSLAHRPEDWKEGTLFVDFRKGPLPKGALVLTSEHRPDHDGLQLLCHDLPEVSRKLSLLIHREAIQALDLIAVTGTNGKSSVVHFAQQLLSSLGHPALALGTLGLNGHGLHRETPNTTNLPLDLHPLLSEVHRSKGKTVFMEASSIGLREDRLKGLTFKSTGWTNLTQDHLDVHGTMESYWQDKRRLLSLSQGVVVYNVDDAYTRRLCGEDKCLSYSISDSGADYHFKEITAHSEGYDLEFMALGQSHRAQVPFMGRHNLSNLLCAMGLVHSVGVSASQMSPALPNLSLPRGRFERAETRALGRTYIDYAHSPDGLERTLRAAKEHFPKQRLKVLFGCGGDRDSAKRAPMGQIASKLADEVWLTSDNSRSEPTSSIFKNIVAGMGSAPHKQFEDREEAIHDALASMKENDVLMICGKGHETEQILGDTTLTMDEFSCCKNF
jgi:UDP-N-acetylmuramyl-tripeptide synthetase